MCSVAFRIACVGRRGFQREAWRVPWPHELPYWGVASLEKVVPRFHSGLPFSQVFPALGFSPEAF